MKIFIRFIVVLVWSTAVELLNLIALLVGQFSAKTQSSLKLRGLSSLRNSCQFQLKEEDRQKLLFFCSSAGEYEQTLPIIREFEREGFACIITFFSESGYNFAIKRQEARQFFLSPIDSYWRWSILFKKFHVESAFVTRHELWPSYLALASRSKHGAHLINASRKMKPSFIGLFIQRFLITFFNSVFVVGPKDLHYYTKTLKIKTDKIRVFGDSKYDSVYQRVCAKRSSSRELLDRLNFVVPSPNRLIVGSAWPPDVSLCLKTLAEIKRSNLQTCQLMIAMHKPDVDAHREIEDECRNLNFNFIYHSEITSGSTVNLTKEHKDVVIIDSMGQLSELYLCAKAAFVGGAMHHKVHNVLEPAFYGLAIAFGPLYKNSQEAINMVEQGMARPIDTPYDLKTWWLKQIGDDYADSKKLLAYLNNHLGVSQKIVHNLLTIKNLL